MRILHVNEFYQRVGGAEVVLLNTMEALEEQGIENVVAHAQLENTIVHNRRAYLISDLNPNINDSHKTHTFQQVLQQEKPDIVHIHQTDKSIIAQISREYFPTIQSVYNHDVYCPGGGKYLPLKEKVCERNFGFGCITSAFLTHCNSVRPTTLISSFNRSRQLLKPDDRISYLAISKYQVDRLTENGIPKGAIKLLPPFTKLPSDAGTEEPTTDVPTLLFTGRITPQKGLDKLLAALLHVKTPYRLVIDGDGIGLGKIKSIARELNLSDRVHFVGWASPKDHLAYYQLASVVIVPSVWPEPFGMVGIEAMSYRKPVVAFNVGGISEWLEDKVTGFLIRPYDIQEMGQRIDDLLKNPEVAHEMGANGRIVVEKKFNDKAYVERLLTIYQEVMSNQVQG